MKSEKLYCKRNDMGKMIKSYILKRILNIFTKCKKIGI